MANDTVIADVGETLIELLRDNMEDLLERPRIVLFSPGEIQEIDDPRLSLFLYRVDSNDYRNNQEMQRLTDMVLQSPPLVLDLFYMLTAYPPPPGGDPTARTLDEHRLLGRAMRVLYDHGTLRGAALRGSLAATETELRVVLVTMSMENTTQMWNSFEGRAYRPSSFYQVTPVAIDSVRQREVVPVIESEMRYEQIHRRREES